LLDKLNAAACQLVGYSGFFFQRVMISYLVTYD